MTPEPPDAATGAGRLALGRPVSIACGAALTIVVAMMAAVICGASVSPTIWLIALAMLVVTIVAMGLRDRMFARLARRAAHLAGLDAEGDTLALAQAALATIAEKLDAVDHRFLHRHPVTGLVTREPLFAMISDAGGTLGLVEFVDFDRLAAFDAPSAERALATIAERVVRMAGRSRPVAHVDRARIAIWFAGEGASPGAELDAIGYALADAIDGPDGPLVPQVRIGWATAQPGEAPAALLNRAIAAESLPGDAPDTADPMQHVRASFGREQELRHAIARDQFELAYQPLIDATACRVNGAEALLRWRHPDHGLVSPSDFVPIIEAAGLSEEVGLWVLNAAARQARRWRSVKLDGLRVAINVSGHQLQRSDLATLVERTLARHKLAGGALEIELTETVASGDADRASAFFAAVRRLGVSIAIDDFGTGYSSLSSLRRLGFDKLKIDREFVTEVDRRADSQAICQSVIALGRGLGIRVLAEGVETGEEFRWLRQHGCTLFQGYYFAPPLGPSDFEQFARDRNGLMKRLNVSPAAVRNTIEHRMSA